MRRGRAPALVGEIGRIVEEPDGFTIQVVVEETAEHARIAIYKLPKRSWDDWWEENAWEFDSSSPAPVAESFEKSPASLIAAGVVAAPQSVSAPCRPKAMYSYISISLALFLFF